MKSNLPLPQAPVIYDISVISEHLEMKEWKLGNSFLRACFESKFKE